VVPLTPGRLGRRRGDVLTSIVDDVDSVVDRELRVRLPLRGYVLVAGLAGLVCALLLPAAGGVVVVTAAVAAAAGYSLARLGAGRAESTAVALRADLSTAVVEVTQLAPELVMWRAERQAVDRVAAASTALTSAVRRAAGTLGAARALVLLLHGVGLVAVALLVAPAVADGTVSGPVAALLVLVPLALADVAVPLADAGALAARTGAAAERLHRLERTAPAVRDTVATRVPRDAAVALHRVSAGWDEGGTALTGLSLDLPVGSHLGLTGASGSGKSTVAALLLRFLDPTAGHVTLGGAPLRAMSLDAVRRRVGLVDDDPHVFASTLVENVRLARPEASDAEVEGALRRASLGPWLDTLPEGLHTWLGDGHAQVSGGERARIAVARSILAAQPVLVLDEPTAHLDHATAEELAREVLLDPAERSVVWISHDGVGLHLVDRVLDLDLPGRVRPPVRS
jgi:ATP-binding cassette subfamily C protein CydCD